MDQALENWWQIKTKNAEDKWKSDLFGRLVDSGMSIEELSERTQIPVDEIQSLLSKKQKQPAAAQT